MPLINWKINLISTWSDKCTLSNDIKATTITIADRKLYVPVVTLQLKIMPNCLNN